MKHRVLFLCVQNTARSQMAEAFVNELCGASVEAHSAGVNAGELNPLAVRAMQELSIDISQHKTKTAFQFYREGKKFSYVIGLYDEVHGERCPIFPGVAQRIDWNFEDPAAVKGSPEEQVTAMRAARDQIRTKIAEWCLEVCPPEERSAEMALR